MSNNPPAAAAPVFPHYLLRRSTDPYEPPSDGRLPFLLALPNFEEDYRRCPSQFTINGKLHLAFTHEDPLRKVTCNRCWTARGFGSHGIHRNECYKNSKAEKSMLHPLYDWDSKKGKKDDSKTFWKNIKDADGFGQLSRARDGRHEEVWMVGRANQAAYFIDPKTDFMGICTFCTKTCSWNRIDEHMEEHHLAIHVKDGNPLYSIRQLPEVTVNRVKKDDDDDSFAIEVGDADPSEEEKEGSDDEDDHEDTDEPQELQTTPKKKKKSPVPSSPKKGRAPRNQKAAEAKKKKSSPKKKGRSPKKATAGVRRSTRNAGKKKA